jgi:hypothetical protein
MFYVVARPTSSASSEKLWLKVLGTLNVTVQVGWSILLDKSFGIG